MAQESSRQDQRQRGQEGQQGSRRPGGRQQECPTCHRMFDSDEQLRQHKEREHREQMMR